MDADPDQTASSDEPIACSLTHEEATSQLDEWVALVDDAVAVERADGLLSLRLPASERARAEDLAARERACCSFLTITVADDPTGTITVRVRSPAPAADPVVSFIGRKP